MKISIRHRFIFGGFFGGDGVMGLEIFVKIIEVTYSSFFSNISSLCVFLCILFYSEMRKMHNKTTRIISIKK